MSLGAAFALSAEQSAELLALGDDERRDEWLQELEEAVEDPDWLSTTRPGTRFTGVSAMGSCSSKTDHRSPMRCSGRNR
jgi:hypothetical protein